MLCLLFVMCVLCLFGLLPFDFLLCLWSVCVRCFMFGMPVDDLFVCFVYFMCVLLFCVVFCLFLI